MKKSDWTGGLTKDELRPARTDNDEKYRPLAQLGEDQPNNNLSTAQAVMEAPAPSEMRYGWHPNLTGR